MSTGNCLHAAVDPQQTAEPLLVRLRAGDALAFEELVRRESPRLLALLRRMLRSEEDARDALQETFLAAFRKLASFEGNARLSTWLYRIALNAALMKLRSRRRHPEEPIDELLPVFDASGHRLSDPEPPASDAGAALDAEARRAAVRRCIDRLPEAQRSVVVLRDIEELGTDETARALGLSPEAAKMRLHRARQALRALLLREGLLAPESARGRRQPAEPPDVVHAAPRPPAAVRSTRPDLHSA